MTIAANDAFPVIYNERKQRLAMPKEFEATENTFLMKWTVEPCESGQRLDHFLKKKYKKRSREEIQRAIRRGRITLNHGPAKPGKVLKVNDRVFVLSVKGREPAVDFDYTVVYEDDHIIVVNKPGNLPVHPTGRFFFNTLLTQLRVDNRNEINQNINFYIVHRVDRETSGLVVMGKTRQAAANLVDQFFERKPFKEYQAIVRGRVKSDAFRIDAPLTKDIRSDIRLRMSVVEMGGDGEPLYVPPKMVLPAESEVRVEQRFDNYSVVRVRPHTGRQHQIRVHLLHKGHPILGDKLYGVADDVFYRNLAGEMQGVEISPGVTAPRHALHAARLCFYHPQSREWMEFESPMPPDMQSLLQQL